MRYSVLLVFIFIIAAAAGGFIIVLNRTKTPAPESVSYTPPPSPAVSQPPTLAASAEYSSTSSSEINNEVNVNVTSGNSKASPSPAVKPQSLSSYIYTGSQVKSSTQLKLELISKADTDVITSWYKEKIRNDNFNAKSFTQTNTNGVILNKLSAAKPNEKIEITIKKDQNVSDVYITVDRP